MPLKKPRAILFDLDGTLADTAPDLAAAVNTLRTERNLEPTPYALLRPLVSAGARGLIGAAFGLKPGDAGYEELCVDFLNRYASRLVVDSTLFDGVADLLKQLEAQGFPWGIVTNKASRFTDPLVPQIGLGHAGCIVSGDTTACIETTSARPRSSSSEARESGVRSAVACTSTRPPSPVITTLASTSALESSP